MHFLKSNFYIIEKTVLHLIRETWCSVNTLSTEMGQNLSSEFVTAFGCQIAVHLTDRVQPQASSNASKCFYFITWLLFFSSVAVAEVMDHPVGVKYAIYKKCGYAALYFWDYFRGSIIYCSFFKNLKRGIISKCREISRSNYSICGGEVRYIILYKQQLK